MNQRLRSTAFKSKKNNRQKLNKNVLVFLKQIVQINTEYSGISYNYGFGKWS